MQTTCAAFLGSVITVPLALSRPPSRSAQPADLPTSLILAAWRICHLSRHLTSASPPTICVIHWYRNINRFPIEYPFGFSLGPDSPWADDPSQVSLGFQDGFTILSYTHAWILTSASSSSSHESTFSLLRNALQSFRFRGFGVASARTFRRSTSRPVSCYALLMMAASKPTSRLSRTYHFLLFTPATSRALSRRSGLFPFVRRAYPLRAHS